MTRAIGVFFALLFIAKTSCFAAPTDPASDASIEECLKVSKADQMMDILG
jgi:hypothetical protein